MFPIWLSALSFWARSYWVSCAAESSGNAKNAAAANRSDQFRNPFRMSIPLIMKSNLEIKVKAKKQFAGVDIGAIGRGTVLMQPVVLVVPGEAGATGHERVVAVADGVSGDVSQVRRSTHDSEGWVGDRSLLRHSDGFEASNEDELGAVDVVGLEQDAVPGGGAGVGGQDCSGGVIQGCGRPGGIDQIAVALAEPGAILAMLGDDLKVEVG